MSATSWQQILTAFQNNGAAAGAWKLPRERVASDLQAAAQAPNTIDQGAFGFCGIAAFLRFWLRRDPAASIRFAVELYDKGASTLGTSYHVTPNQGLRSYDYLSAYRTGRPRCPPGQWMVMSAIQDSISAAGFDGTVDNSWLAFLSLHEGAQPNQIARLFSATGIYGNVDDRIDWASIVLPREPFLPDPWRPTAGDAEALTPGATCDVILQINDRFLTGASPMPSGLVGDLQGDFPNHFVALGSRITIAGNARARIWTWANYQQVAVPAKAFLENYYGAIVCMV